MWKVQLVFENASVDSVSFRIENTITTADGKKNNIVFKSDSIAPQDWRFHKVCLPSRNTTWRLEVTCLYRMVYSCQITDKQIVQGQCHVQFQNDHTVIYPPLDQKNRVWQKALHMEKTIQCVTTLWEQLDHYGVLGLSRDASDPQIEEALKERQQQDFVQRNRALQKRLQECQRTLLPPLGSLEKKMYDCVTIPRHYVSWNWFRSYFNFKDPSCYIQLGISLVAIGGGIVLTIATAGVLSTVGVGLVCAGVKGVSHVLSEETRRLEIQAEVKKDPMIKWWPFVKSFGISFVAGSLACASFGLVSSVISSSLSVSTAMVSALQSGASLATSVWVFTTSSRLIQCCFRPGEAWRELCERPGQVLETMVKDLLTALLAGVFGALAAYTGTVLVEVLEKTKMHDLLDAWSHQLWNTIREFTHSVVHVIAGNVSSLLSLFLCESSLWADPWTLLKQFGKAICSSSLMSLAICGISTSHVFERKMKSHDSSLPKTAPIQEAPAAPPIQEAPAAPMQEAPATPPIQETPAAPPIQATPVKVPTNENKVVATPHHEHKKPSEHALIELSIEQINHEIYHQHHHHAATPAPLDRKSDAAVGGCIGFKNQGLFFAEARISWQNQSEQIKKYHGEFAILPADAHNIVVELCVLRNPFGDYTPLFRHVYETPPRLLFVLDGTVLNEQALSPLSEFGAKTELPPPEPLQGLGWHNIVV